MWRALLLAPFLLAGCKWQLNPNAGLFSCTTGADCGDGWECVTLAAGGGRCHLKGTCVEEKCNGLDDNCDGRIDESFPESGKACTTGQAGPCGAGTNVCSDAGTLSCQRTYTPVAETCNGLDDDCQNGVDDGFNLGSDNQNCGACSKRCGVGSQCTSAQCRETNCSDGLDNDDGGDPDCLDLDCLSVSCGDGGFNCGARLELPDAGVTDGGPGDAGPSDAGLDDAGTSDAGTADAGTADAGFVTVQACVPREAICNNGLDDDLDGKGDCSDPDCNGRACGDGGTCMMGMCR